MTSQKDLAVIRRAFARQIAFASRSEDPRLEEAFAAVRREDFVGPGPWLVPSIPRGHRKTPSADPVYLYADVLVALKPEAELNNGQPSFLAFLIGLGRIREGEHVAHIGAGVGYYTAVMAQLAGPSGRVTAIEYEADLAERAAANLAAFPQANVVAGDGTTLRLAPADVILVNAGATQPADVWLDALKDGGRLILPLTVDVAALGPFATGGAIFLIERRGADFSARWMSQTGIYPCIGLRDAEAEGRLAKAFKKGGEHKVARLVRTDDAPAKDCWVRGPGWALTYR